MARNYLKAAIGFIRKHSPQNADLVKARIINSTGELPVKPTRHPADKYDGSYRAYELYKFRISYFVTTEHIRIVRIRNPNQEPVDY